MGWPLVEPDPVGVQVYPDGHVIVFNAVIGTQTYPDGQFTVSAFTGLGFWDTYPADMIASAINKIFDFFMGLDL